AQAFGDPMAELERGGRRLFSGETAALPNPGALEVNFDPPDTGDALAAETRALFKSVLDPQKHKLREFNFEAHDWEAHRAIRAAGLLFPEWPRQWGGRNADAQAVRAANAVWLEAGYAGLPRGVTGMAGALVQSFGQPALQDEVLLAFARGEATSCL